MAEMGTAELMELQQGMSDLQSMIFTSLYGSERKDRNTALILSICLGVIGIDRFYVGDMGLGTLKLLTLGLFGILYVVDCFRIMGRADEYNRNKAREIAAAIRASS